MKRVNLAPLLFGGCLIFAVAGEKDFWARRPYNEWNEKEVEKLLKNSPWAKTVTLSIGLMARGRGGLLDERAEMESVATPRAPGEGTNPESGAVPGGGGGYRPGREPGFGGYGDGPQATVVIIWYSRPIRQARARQLQLRNAETSQEQLNKILDYRSTNIEFLVVGWRSQAQGGKSYDAFQKLREETYLQKKNKEKIPLANLILPSGTGQSLVFSFPRELDGKPVLRLEDKEVDLVTRIGGNTIRTRFKLSDMVVNGQLEL